MLATGTGIAPFCLFLWNMFFEKHDHYKEEILQDMHSRLDPSTHLCVLFHVVAVGDLIVLGSSSTRCVRQGSSSSAHPWRTSSSSPAIRPGMPSQNGTFNLVLLQRLEVL
ncbi:hypothetical protein ZEAMMB73_Zm00001d036041 [Zea mays]|uniref:Uncharacterized protein n=1 Tax=Zea mays TaxID=4577 RepID=A0A1D6LKG5_MAIZE|nr:hypothetical protein ZEAMMB73_Zm00001d036041 [Zea mays]